MKTNMRADGVIEKKKAKLNFERILLFSEEEKKYFFIHQMKPSKPINEWSVTEENSE